MSGNMAAAFADANRPTVALQNPLDIYGKAADVVNALNANQAFRARQAAGEAYQQATDPTTGLVDPARAQALIAARPDAALAAQPSATSGQALSQAQQSQGIQRNDAISQLLGPVLALPDAQLHDGAVAATQRAMQMGITTQQEGMTLLAHLPNDPAALRQRLEQVRMSLLPPDQQRAAIYGSPLTYTAPGGTLAGGMQSQQTGAVSVPPQAGAPQGLDAGSRGAVSTITNPDGSQTTDTLEGHMAKGRVTPLGALAPGYKAAAAPPGGPRDYTNAPNELLGGLPNPSEAAQPPATPSAVAGGTTVPAGLVQGQTADITRYKQDQAQIPARQQNVQSLQKAQIALEASNTGRSSQGVHDMLATMQTLGIPTAGLADSVASYDLAHKYLTDYARKSGAAANSDLQLKTSEGANASTGINQQAALDVVHTNIGRERQAVAQAMEAPQTGVGYGAHASKFSTDTDPRGFAVDAYKPSDLNPNDPKSMVGRMTSGERAKFYKSVGIAKRLGLINVGQ